MSDPIDIFTRKKREIERQKEQDEEVFEPCPQAIEIVEGLLERVKKGEIRSFTFAATTEAENVITAWTASMFENPYVFLGLLETIKTEINLYLASVRSDDDDEDYT